MILGLVTALFPDSRPEGFPLPSDRVPSERSEATSTASPSRDRTRRRLPTAVERSADRVSLRRGVTGVLLTVVLPGSVQIAAGNKSVGRTALRVWLGLWLLAAVALVIGLVRRDVLVSLAASGWFLVIVQYGVLVLGIAMSLLLIDAWRLGRPTDMAPRHRLGFVLLTFVLIGAVMTASVVVSRTVASHRALVDHLFAGGGDSTTETGRYNILLLGADAGDSRVGLRPDSITVASVAADTGRTVLFSLPRNLEDVPFPDGSPMKQEFPDGFTCENHECMLNGIYTWASEHPELYPDADDPGAQATKEAVENLLGLKINYYAMVDLKGFESLIDAVGGIRMDINERVPIGGGTSPISGWIEPGENVHLDGFHALWFARSREGASDYVRMERQKCVMAAMLQQLDPVTVLTKFSDIAKAGEEIAVTDVPQSKTGGLVELAMKARDHKISSVAFTPPLIYPGSPDFAKMREVVANRIAKSEAKDHPSATPTPDGSPTPTEPSSPPTSANPPSSPSDGGATSGGISSPPSASSSQGNESEDLDEVCRAR